MDTIEQDLAEAAAYRGPGEALVARLAAHVRERLAVNVGLLNESHALKRQVRELTEGRR